MHNKFLFAESTGNIVLVYVLQHKNVLCFEVVIWAKNNIATCNGTFVKQ